MHKEFIPKPALRTLPVAIGLAFAICGLAVSPHQAWAQASSSKTTKVIDIHIPAGPLTKALNAFADRAGVTLSFDPQLTAGKQTSGIKGSYEIRQGFEALLSGSGLAVTYMNGNYSLKQAPLLPASTDAAILPEVNVMASGESNDPVRPYAGGQVARGARLGMLGNVSNMALPFNSTAYTAELIENQQARNLIDVLVNDPSVSDAGGRNFDNFFIRGFSISREEIGFNGLYGIASAEGNTLQGIERVEILKGPTTLVNGGSPKGAAGGAINLVPKRADDVPLTRLTGTYLSDGNLGTHLDVGRRFGENNEFGARLNLAYRDGDSPVNHETQRASVATAGLDYRGDRLRVSGDFGSSRQRLNQEKGTFVVGATTMPVAPSGEINIAQPWSYQDKEHDFAMIKGEFDLADDLMLGLAYGQAESRRDRIEAFSYIQNAAGDVSGSAAGLRSHTKTHSGDVNLRWKLKTGGIGHTVVLSATDFSSKITNYQPSLNYSFSTNIYNPVYNIGPGSNLLDAPMVRLSNTSLRSYALADTLSMIDDRLLVTIGARRQSIQVNKFNYVTGVPEERYDRSKVTPALAALFKYSPHTSLYANYVEALSEGAIASSSAINRGEVFAPFVSKQAEVGIKNEWGNWSSTLSLFQITRPSGFIGTGNIYRVDGEQRNRGVEWQVFGEPSKGWRVLGGAAWTQARLVSTQNGTNDGRQAAGAPEWKLRLGSEWDVRSMQGLTTNARILYTSSQPVLIDNSVRIPAWTRLDLGARYATKLGGRDVSFRAVIENVTNHRYWEAVPDFMVVSSGAPRTLMLSATVDF